MDMRSGGSSGFSRAWTRTLGKLSAPHGAVWSLNGPRLGASAILLTYSLVVVLAGRAIQGPGELGLESAACGPEGRGARGVAGRVAPAAPTSPPASPALGTRSSGANRRGNTWTPATYL